MKEIRFRCWDGNQFRYSVAHIPFTENFPLFFLSSGLFSADSREIFAGDIVELVNGEEKIISEVKFVNGCMMIHQANSLDTWTELWRYMKNWKVSIIGNVYETEKIYDFEEE